MPFLLRFALALCPAEFRSEYGDQIAADVHERRLSLIAAAWDVLLQGVALRFDTFVGDAAYALRRLRKSPLFVSIVVLTFALGIGANVAVFSVLNAVVLKPLPFKDPSGIVVILDGVRGGRAVLDNLSLADPLDMREVSGLSATTAFGNDGGTMLAGGEPIAISGFDVMPEYFEILGINAELGRVLTPADAAPGVHNIVISDKIWRGDFAADPGVIGKMVRVNDVSERIVGVLKPQQPALDPRGSLEPQDYYAALPERATVNDRGSRYYSGFARLAPGSTMAEVNGQLELLSARLERQYPRMYHNHILSVVPVQSALLGKAASVLWIVFAAVIGILLIACANVGNMLGARWSTRDRELAVRRALGASSRRIGAQLLIEAGVLALVGAAAGVALAYVSLFLLSSLLADALPRASTISIDALSLLYAAVTVVVATLLAGISPMLSLGSSDLQTVLKSAGRGGDASSHHRLRSTLVVLEIALALALVVVSGLTVRSFIELVNTPLGIRSEGVVASAQTTLPEKDLGTPIAREVMQRQLLAHLQTLPGVQSAALTVQYPLGYITMRTSTWISGRSYPPGTEPNASDNAVTPEYFRVLGIPLVRGRVFSPADTMNAAPVAIVNEAFVNKYLQGMSPIGTRIRGAAWTGTGWAQIVGVVGDERDDLTAPPYPEFYVPMAQAPAAFTSAIVYAPDIEPSVISREMQGAFAATLPTVQPPNTFTVPHLVANRTAQARFATLLLLTLACVALALALSGIFGVVSFSVTQRSREFGVRMALGATEPAVLADVLRRTFVTTAIGVAIGLVIAALAARAIASQLGSISPFDPMTFGVVVLLIFCSALLASLHPALRATRIQPVEALRYE